MKTKNKCPCTNCLLIPICKYKTYLDLIKCDLLEDFLFDHEPGPKYDKEYRKRRELATKAIGRESILFKS